MALPANNQQKLVFKVCVKTKILVELATQTKIIIGVQVDRASATEMVALDLNQTLQLPCLAFSIERDSVKPPLCVVDRWHLD